MDKFFCNLSYPILFNNASSFSENFIGDSINNPSSNFSSAEQLYDFFFNDDYEKQLKKNDKNN